MPACTRARPADPQHLRALRTARRSCWRCSSTRARARAILATCRRSRASFPQVRFAAVAIKGRPRRAARGAASRARADAARSATTTTARWLALYKVATCPQVSFAYPGGVGAEPGAALAPSAGDAARARAAAAREPARAAAAAGERPAARGRGRAGGAGARLAARARSSRSCRRCGCTCRRSRCAAPAPLTGDSPPDVDRASARTVEPLPRRARDRRAPRAGAGRLPRVLPPHRPRSRRRAHADRGGRARAHAARRLSHGRAARGRAADRAARHRRPGVGARRATRRRPARASARAARASASAAPRDAPLLPSGRLVVADAGAALAVLFGELAPGHEPQRRARGD